MATIVVRNVFQAKYGRGDELVNLFKEANERWGDNFGANGRILTDLSGRFFTVVVEEEAESLGEWERLRAEGFANPEFGAWFERMIPLVESGTQEFYTLVADTRDL